MIKPEKEFSKWPEEIYTAESMTMEYKIVAGSSSEELAERVMSALAEGWRPQGGVSVCVHSYENERKGYTESNWIYSQAVVKG